jgi:hypothetical protein
VPDPVRTRTVAPATTPVTASPSSTSSASVAPDPSAVADGAAAEVSRARSVASTPAQQRATALDRAARGVAQAMRDGGVEAAREHMRQNPDSVRAFANARPDQLDAALARHGAPFGTDSVIENQVDSVLRLGVRRVGNQRLDARVGELRNLERHVLANLDAYRDAEPGTAKAQLAEALGIRGDEGDAARVRERVEQTVAHVTSLRDALSGQTIVPGDFPQTARTAGQRERWTMEPGTLGARAAAGSTTEGVQADDVASNAMKALEVALEGRRVLHSLHSLVTGAEMGGAALELGAFGLGIAAGMIIHHETEERHQGRIDGLHTFGVN